MDGKRTWLDWPLTRILPAAWCMATIWWLSDRSTFPRPPGDWLDWNILAHFGIFGTLGISLWFGLGMNGRLTDRERSIYAIVLTVAYGMLDEFHQRYTPGRQSDPFDVLVDFLGAATFVLVIPRLYDRFVR